MLACEPAYSLQKSGERWRGTEGRTFVSSQCAVDSLRLDEGCSGRLRGRVESWDRSWVVYAITQPALGVSLSGGVLMHSQLILVSVPSQRHYVPRPTLVGSAASKWVFGPLGGGVGPLASEPHND